MTERRASGKEIFGWAMFDFANSAYTTVIITVVYSVIFPRLIVGDGPDYRLGNLLWSVALSASYLVVMVCAPVCGAIMDFTAAKKRFLFASYLLTVLTTAALYFVTPGQVALGVALIIVSNIGFALSESFVSSFLPQLGPPEALGRISGYAWGLGYLGGLSSTAIVIFGLGPLSAANFSNLRLVGPITGLFFLVAAVPTFLWVRERGVPRRLAPGEGAVATAFRRLRTTLRDARDYRDLVTLLTSFFFAYAGLSIVISFAFIYGDQVIRWSAGTQVLMFVLTQLTAAAGAVAFGFLQDRFGAKPGYAASLLLWLSAVGLIYGVDGVTRLVNRGLGVDLEPQHVFLVVGSLAGLGLGATQSACRAMVGLFAPAGKAAELFGLWSLTGRAAAITGLLGLGLLQASLGLERAILLCSAFFLAALVLVLPMDVGRGMQAARAHTGE